MQWRPITERSFVTVAMAVVFLSGAVSAYPGPCTTEISELQKTAQSQPPSLPQNLGIQAHHQPTVSDVENAQNQAKAEAATAFDRAQKADAQDDAAACTEAVAQLKKIYAIREGIGGP